MPVPQSSTCATAEIVVVNKGARDVRLGLLEQGVKTPREFFYGFHHLRAAGLDAAMMASAGRMSGLAGGLFGKLEDAVAAFTAVGARPLSARIRMRAIPNAKAIISFTDGFTLSLGLCPRDIGPIARIGGFQGLCDIEGRSNALARPLAHAIIRDAVAGLDHVFFFSPSDREEACERYGIARERTSLFRFGVDTDFWHPLPDAPQQDFAFAIGQDPSRDFATLARAPGAHPTRIVTNQVVQVSADAHHVHIVPGEFSGGGELSDDGLRQIYNSAAAIVVPLKDVHQPSGQSVTLQAMSCGRPVILSRIKGLWAPALLRDGQNCLLVPPGDANALGAAIARLRIDRDLAARLGRAARETALTHFGLDTMGQDAVALARFGLSLAYARQGKVVAA